MGVSRRDFLARTMGMGWAATIAPGGGRDAPRRVSTGRSDPAMVSRRTVTHPHIYVTAEPTPGLRSVEALRADIRDGRAGQIWEGVLARAEAERQAAPLTPSDPLPGRTPEGIAARNPDFYVTFAAGQRVLRAALAHLVTGRADLKEAALRQIEALVDPRQWPDWIDQAHFRFEHPADLRTGMLSLDVALAYDWLYPSLSAAERTAILEGLDRRGIQPFLTSVAQDPWWVHDLNNWLTVIVGGLGIAGMALGDDHPDAADLVAYARPRMRDYLAIYGPEGEFNESVAYASATRLPVAFDMAYRYHTGGADNPLARAPYPATGRWVMYLTLPPGRVAAFGDAHVDAAPYTRYIAAIAAAARDPHLQWFYLQYPPPEPDAIELLWYDPRLDAAHPQGVLPLGRAFAANGGAVSSRSSWDPRAAACVVYGKAGREENHEHNDIGQVCIDGYGERLIVDPGSPRPTYPPDFFDEGRWQYYPASIVGHNVLQFGEREMIALERERGEPVDHERLRAISGRFLDTGFDDERGGFWSMDLTGAYPNVSSVRRTVVHLLPGIAVVFDRAVLDAPNRISLRWHTAAPAVPAPDGAFRFTQGPAALTAHTVSLDTPAVFTARRHGYAPPYDRGRHGELLARTHEPYVEAVAYADTCRFLTCFAVTRTETPPEPWRWNPETGRAEISLPDGDAEVVLTDAELRVGYTDGRAEWTVRL